MKIIKPRQVSFRIDLQSITTLKKYAKQNNLSLNRALMQIIAKSSEVGNEQK